MKKNKDIEEKIEKILKPFVYEKYGKIYVGHKETEGALRVEGLVVQLQEALAEIAQQSVQEYKKDILKKLPRRNN